MEEFKPITILSGVAGSVAQGLSTPLSDKDLHGVYSYRTPAFWGLTEPPESIVHKSPDEAYHELRKFLLLALKSNPTVLELLWLPEYLSKEPKWGDGLLYIRWAFLSKQYVRASYLGFALSLMHKADGGSMRTEIRNRKNLKHAVRILEQGLRLYTTGTMQVYVEDREVYDHILNDWSVEKSQRYALQRYHTFESATPHPSLPEVPDREIASKFLQEYRAAHV